MARCEGTTKAGARCKRTAPEGERFCSIHGSQAGREQPEAPKEAERPDQTGGDGDTSPRSRIPGARHVETGEDLLHVALGVAATLALFWLIRRGPKLPGL